MEASYISYIIALLAGLSIVMFAMSGFLLFSKGWKTYEDNYLEGTEKTLDAMFLSMPAQNLLYLSLVCFLFIGGITLLITGTAYLAIPLGFLSFFAPQISLKMLKKYRDKKFLAQLPDAITSISNSMKSGFSLVQAIDRVTGEMPNPMAQELRLMLYEVRLGVSLDDSLKNISRRMPSQDIDIMINAVLMSMEVGGNLAEIFDKISETIRERNRIEGKIKSLTAQGKMQGVVISMTPFALLGALYTFERQLVIDFFSQPIGWAIFTAVLILIALGALSIAKIVKIEV